MENQYKNVTKLPLHIVAPNTVDLVEDLPLVIDGEVVSQLKSLLLEFCNDKRIENIRIVLKVVKQPALSTSRFLEKQNVLATQEKNREVKELEITSKSAAPSHLGSPVVSNSFDWQKVAVGRLEFFGEYTEGLELDLKNLTVRVVRLLNRLHANEKMKLWYQFDAFWVGNSNALRDVEVAIEGCATAKRHIAIIGDKGTGKKIAALRLLCHSTSKVENFSHLNLADLTRAELVTELTKLLAQTDGVIYISGLSKIMPIDWPLLTQLLEQLSHEVRLIFGIRNELGQISTLQEYLSNHCLTLTLPNLQQRQQDVGAIAKQYWQHQNVSKLCKPPATLLQQLEKITWKNNAKSLHLLLQSTFDKASRQPMAEFSLHELLACHPDLGVMSEPEAHSGLEPHSGALPVGALYSSQFAELLHPEQEHPAILKALTYLADHFKESFSLTDLADHAFVSASHLSYLFKKRFGKSFKRILIDIRIDKAQQILRRYPLRQITQICGDVGFVDLSHFEKTFKKTTGLTPRQYREQYRKRLPIEAQRQSSIDQ